MQELIILALALIGATVTWNIGRALKARKSMLERSQLYSQNEAAAAELGRQREELRVLRARYAQAACLSHFKDTQEACAAMWQQVDNFVAQSAQHVMRTNFIAALAEMCKATTVAREFLKDRLPIAFYDAKHGTMNYYLFPEGKVATTD